VIGGHLPFTLSSSHPVPVDIRVLEYSIRYSIEYSSSSSKRVDSHSPNDESLTMTKDGRVPAACNFAGCLCPVADS